jgi:hypothetical protein
MNVFVTRSVWVAPNRPGDDLRSREHALLPCLKMKGEEIIVGSNIQLKED